MHWTIIIMCLIYQIITKILSITILSDTCLYTKFYINLRLASFTNNIILKSNNCRGYFLLVVVVEMHMCTKFHLHLCYSLLV